MAARATDPWAMAIKNPPKTIQEIDDLVFALYPGGGEGEGRLNTKANSSNLVRDTFEIAFVMNGLESVDTSCHEYDCLIHSFLLGISPNFRRLTRAQKNSFADRFRREVMPNYAYLRSLTEEQRTDLLNLLARRPATHGNRAYLTTLPGEILGKVFNVNVVFLDKYGLSRQTYGTTAEQQRELVGIFTTPGLPYIFIYNPDMAHYRIVRRMEDNRYFFDAAEATSIIHTLISPPEKVTQVLNKGKTLKNLRTEMGVKNYTENIEYLKTKGFTNKNISTLSLRANPSNIRMYVNSVGLSRENIYSQMGLYAPPRSLPPPSSSEGAPGAGNGSIKRKVVALTPKNYLRHHGVTNAQINKIKNQTRMSNKEIAESLRKGLKSGQSVKNILSFFGINIAGGTRRRRR